MRRQESVAKAIGLAVSAALACSFLLLAKPSRAQDAACLGSCAQQGTECLGAARGEFKLCKLECRAGAKAALRDCRTSPNPRACVAASSPR